MHRDQLRPAEQLGRGLGPPRTDEQATFAEAAGQARQALLDAAVEVADRAEVLRAADGAPAALAAGRAGVVSCVWPTLGRRRSRDGRIRRIAAKMSVLLVAGGSGWAAGIPASASVPASASARGWSVTPSPNPVIPTGQLLWVSCPAANSCTAVGTYVKASGAGVVLAEQWNGSKWRSSPS
jgi:hypothetical protein